MNRGARIEPTPPECALAAEMFDHFCSAGTMKQILALHREICNTLTLKPNRLPDFYPKLKTKLSSSWKAQALFKKFDARANHKVYAKGRICSQSKVLIIGAGPCGLRAAIECQLLGAKVVVVEKRDRISRNNVLHLWPFVIHDLRALGAKKFFGKFCAGSIDHISIRQLQCILLKVALLLGAEIHEGVGFEELLEPTVTENSETLGWRARVTPADHPVAQYEFDCLIGADGKRNTLQGFKRKEFRGKLAMAITANFINRHSEQEASVPEISGVAFIFNQKFFKDLYEETGIDLENIVYYKDDTHYFVMTAKKHSLLDKGVLLKDFADVSRLLSVENVDRDALMRYAQEAARFSTDGRLPLKDFALNHYGEPDVALFDFTSMYAAENASMVYERHGRRLLSQLVGDSLLEPFWPTGSGCARGFLSALDASWVVRTWGQSPSPHPLEVIAERESIYRLLAQTTPENLQRDFGAYTLDPCTRYPNLNRAAVTPHRVTSFYDSDDPLPLDALPAAKKRRREIEVSDEVLLTWAGITEGGLRAACSVSALTDLLNRYRPDLLANANNQKTVYSVLQHEFGISQFSSTGSTREIPEAKLRSYLSRVYNAFKGEVPHIHHQSDVFTQLKQNQQKEKHFRTAADHNVSMYSNAGDTSHSSYRKKRRAARAAQEEGRPVGIGSRALGGGARVAKLAAELSGNNNTAVSPRASKPKDLMRSVGKIERDDWNVREIEKKIKENRLGRPEPTTAEKVPKWDREQFLGRQKKLKEGENEEKWSEIDETLQKLEQKLRDSGRPDHGTKKVANLATKFVKTDQQPIEPVKVELKEPCRKSWRGPSSTGMQCAACGTRVFAAEGVIADGLHLHRSCFRCAVCKTVLRPGNYTMERYGTRLVCLRHSGVSVTDAITALTQSGAKLLSVTTPERISIEVSDSGAREIDEDEWTDRNCLASETSGAGGLSDEEDSSSDEYTDAATSDNEADQSPEPAGLAAPRQTHCNLYCSDDSFGYDDYSDDGAESSGNESCSRMREAREARRREVPADARPPTDSSELESEEESESSDEELSSATKVSTDSEFAREECMIGSAPPPAILITEVVNPAPSPPEFPLSRTRSAGGLATKRALELKRKYLLGEPSPPAVRKSDSTSQIDTKLEAFRSNITEFQKMLHPAPTPAASSQIVLNYSPEENKSQPMPDIIKNLCKDAPVDLLTKVDSPLNIEDLSNKNNWTENTLKEETKEDVDEMDTDSLSEEPSSHTQTAPNQTVPRVEVHDEGGELVQMDSLTINVNSNDDNDEKVSGTATITGPTVVAAESESSESCRDANTLMLTETELSDWAAENVVLDDCGFDEKIYKTKHKALGGPKMVHEAKNLSTASSHVCGRASPSESVVYSNALEHFEFADEGETDLSIETPVTPRNEGYMELVDDDYDPYAISNDRSINFIEQKFADTVFKPIINQQANLSTTNETAPIINTVVESHENQESTSVTTEYKESTIPNDDSVNKSDLKITDTKSVNESSSGTCKSPSNLLNESNTPKNTQNDNNYNIGIHHSPLKSPEAIAKAQITRNNICRSASENFHRNLLSLLLEENTELPVVNPEVKSNYEFGKSSTYSSVESQSNEIMKKEVSDHEESTSPISPPVVSSTPISKPLEPYKSSQYTHNEDLIKKYFYMLPTPSPTHQQSNSSNVSEITSPLKNRSNNTMRLYSPAICRSASENFHRNMSTSLPKNNDIAQTSPTSRTIQDSANKVQEIKREREEQTDIVRRLVLERLGTGPRVCRKSSRRTRASPLSNIPPPVPPPPDEESPPPRPAPPLMPLPVTPSFSDPELARERRSKGIIKSISSYLNRRLGPRHKEVGQQSRMVAHKSTGALQEPPPVPPPPVAYQPPTPASSKTPLVKRAHNSGGGDVDERDAMQLWFEARWSRLLAQRKAREDSRDEPTARRVARLERRLSRPLSAVEQAATVAELVNVCAQRDAHKALIEADKRRSGGSSGIGDSRP